VNCSIAGAAVAAEGDEPIVVNIVKFADRDKARRE
jgi:hypothetical protein